MERLGRRVEHLLRRAGFGAGPAEHTTYGDLTYREVVDLLVEYEWFSDTVDSYVGQPGYAGITVKTQFLPNTVINDARQRWLFRMMHSDRPLQEKMALFWHNHFATAYSKIAGAYGSTEGARMMAAKPDGGCRRRQRPDRAAAAPGPRQLPRSAGRGGQGCRRCSCGSTAARTSRARPQENFARELMELFTMGVGFYTEADVYAGARVFTGWNLQRIGVATDPASHYEFFYNAAQHDTTAKTFSFPDLHRRHPDDSGARGGRRHAGRPRPDRGGRQASRDEPPAGPEALRVLRERNRGSAAGVHRGAGRRLSSRATTRCEPLLRCLLHLVGVP